MIAEKLKFIQKQIAISAESAGRDPHKIKLICVTKQANLAQINEIIGLGINDLGESRLQQARLRKAEIAAPVVWHMIGHLQKNKAGQAVKIFNSIHSVDSIELASLLNRHCGALGRVMEVLLQVNVAGEASKYGFSAQDIFPALDKILKFKNLNITGLMMIAPMVDNPESVRPYFAKLRKLRDNLNTPQVLQLSMGMSHDYTVAIQEGADIIRLGTVIFGK
ncbi:MAG: YggS family pyridoxal phosphate-dependent enzyme [Candidatus Omnitrophota bacterium]